MDDKSNHINHIEDNCEHYNEELKSCPFCGGKAKLVGGEENWKPTYYDPDSGGDPIAILCETCECGLHYFEDYGDAIKAWNKRVQYKLRTAEDIQTLDEAINTINGLRKVNRELRAKLYPKKEKSDDEIKENTIMSTAYFSGHSIYFDENINEWKFKDTDELVNNNRNRPCVKCNESPTLDGHDYCIKNLGKVINACCGHGVERGYIHFDNGIVIRGYFDIEYLDCLE